MVISTLFCGYCHQPFQPTNKRQRFCSARHRAAANYLPTKMDNETKRLADLPRKNEEFASRNRDRSIGFDGRYGGPENTSYVVSTPVAC
jgi:hypothetical protein